MFCHQCGSVLTDRAQRAHPNLGRLFAVAIVFLAIGIVIGAIIGYALWENPTTLEFATSGAPLRRIGEPDEIAGAAVFLASKAGAFMTGQAIVIDGGATI